MELLGETSEGLRSWISELEAAGMTVTMGGDHPASSQDTRAGSQESLAEEPLSGSRESAEPLPATLWITDDPERAKEHVRHGTPTLGYLSAGDEGADFGSVRYLATDLTELDADYLDKVYRRHAGIPWDILDTERCHLRETTEADVDAFYDIYAEPSVTAYMEDLFPDREQELAYARDYAKNIYEFFGFGVWTVCLRETGEVIGRAGLSYREGFEDPELGFLIGVPWQGKGIATEVCRAVLQFGRKELEFARVIAFAEPENAASNHILKKLGFREREKVLILGRDHVRWEYCGWRDDAV